MMVHIPPTDVYQTCDIRRSQSRFFSCDKGTGMKREGSKSNFWSLSDIELARNCRVIAESGSESIAIAIKSEARRLYSDWRDAINFPIDDRQEKARRATVMAALRKRTIQILVKLSERQ